MKMEGRQQGRRLAYKIRSQRGYTTQLDLVKGRYASAGTRRGNKKTHDFSASRSTIGIHNSNAQQISYALVGDHQLRYSHRSPPKTYIKR